MDIELKARWKGRTATDLGNDLGNATVNFYKNTFGLDVYLLSCLKAFMKEKEIYEMYVSLKCRKRELFMLFERYEDFRLHSTYRFSINGHDYNYKTIKNAILEFKDKFLKICIEDEKKCLTKNKLNYE